MSTPRFFRSLVSCSLLVAGFLLVQTPIAAQDNTSIPAPGIQPLMHFSHLTSDDGLAQNGVESILQDQQGFMWIGTSSGLSRYDGYHFKNYQHDPDNSNSLSSNWVRDLIEGQDGTIWIATEGGGVNKLDPRTETFTRYPFGFDDKNRVSSDRAFRLLLARNGDLWISSGGNQLLTRLNPTTNGITTFQNNADQSLNFKAHNARGLLEDHDGNIWISGDGTLAKFDIQKQTFSYINLSSDENGLIPLLQDDSGTIWVGGNKGLYQLDAQKGELILYPLDGGVNDLKPSRTGFIWVATGKGLGEFNLQTHQWSRHEQHDEGRSDSLNSDTVRRLYIDRQGLLWVGTAKGGSDVFDPHQDAFGYYGYDPHAAQSLAMGNVGDVFVTQAGPMWVGVGSSLDYVDVGQGKVTHYRMTDAGLPDSPIASVYQDHGGTVWVGTRDFHLYRFDPESKQFTANDINSTRKGPGQKAIVDMAEDADGNLWLAVNQDGMYLLDRATGKTTFYENPPNPTPKKGNPPPIPNGGKAPSAPISSLYVDQQGMFWISTLNGMRHFDPRTRQYDLTRIKPETEPGPDSFMEAAVKDDKGILWIASHDGLIQYDPQAHTVKYYTEKDGLANAFLMSIMQDKNGDLWLGTLKGLSRFSPTTGKFRNYDKADGLQGNEFNEGAFAQTADGQLIFGGTNGLNIFDPDRLQDDPYQAPLALTDFQLKNQSVTPRSIPFFMQPIWNTTDLSLPPDQNILSFEFTALSFAAPTKNRYRYELEGFETQWNETSSQRRFITYTNLPSGTYTLRVQGSNNDGVWSSNEARLSLSILPPWWEKPIFRVLAALIIIGLIWGAYRWRIRSIRLRNVELEREVAKQTLALRQRTDELQTSEVQLRQAKDAAEAASRAKSAFVANMSHELRSPLNAILGFAQVTNRNQAIPPEAHENLDIILKSGEHLLGLINQVLDMSKIEAGQQVLHEVDFDLYSLWVDVEDMFILKADSKNLQLVFERAAEVPRYIHADVIKLRQVLINLIGNALKFTTTGKVSVRIRQLAANTDKPPRLQFEIEDSGPGIAPDELSTLFEAFVQTTTGLKTQEGTGLGLAISRKFIQLMGGDITVKSQVGQGTTFQFEITCVEVSPATSTMALASRQAVGLQAGQPTYRVLVADDKWANRQLMVQLLRPFGFDVREAENGKQAVEIAQVFQPHAIFMDMRMPVMNGLDATRQIKSSQKDDRMVIIALTASAFDDERVTIIAAGCDDFVRKPFHTEEIIEMLSKHVGVQFVYEQEAAPTSAYMKRSQKDDLRSAIDNIPAELIVRLGESIELGDIKVIDRIIKEIHTLDAMLADALSQLANQYEYDKLLKVLRETVQ